MKRVLFLCVLLTIGIVGVYSQDLYALQRELESAQEEAQRQLAIFQTMEVAVIITSVISGLSLLCLWVIALVRPAREEQMDSVIRSLDSISKSLKNIENRLDPNVCPNCGAEFSGDEQFCSVCGTKRP